MDICAARTCQKRASDPSGTPVLNHCIDSGNRTQVFSVLHHGSLRAKKAACESLLSQPAVRVTRPELKRWGLVAIAFAHGAGSLAPLPFVCMCMMCVGACMFMCKCRPVEVRGQPLELLALPCLRQSLLCAMSMPGKLACELRGSVLLPRLTLAGPQGCVLLSTHLPQSL